MTITFWFCTTHGKNLVKSIKYRYILSKLDQTRDSKSQWRVIKSFINPNTTCSFGGIIHNGKSISHSADIAQIFNNYFISIGPQLAAGIPTEECITQIHTRNLNSDYSFSFHPTCGNEILKIITELEDSAAGWDGIKANVIKTVGQYIVNPLMYIINLSFDQSISSQSLKEVVVCPIHKSKSSVNYRPVSILIVLSKIFEKCTYTHLYNHFTLHNLLELVIRCFWH